METLLNRYRNITVLLLVIFAQLVLIAVQVRNDRDVRMVRVWSVTAITPLAKVLETLRGGTSGFFQNYILMHDAREDNRRLQGELDRLKMENQFLKTELSTAEHAKALASFTAQSPSKMLAARIIAAGTGAVSTAAQCGSKLTAREQFACLCCHSALSRTAIAFTRCGAQQSNEGLERRHCR